MMNLYFFIAEFGTMLAFLAVLHHERTNRRLLEVLFLAFLYGIILEVLNIYMSHVYAYSPDFVFQIAGVPIAIGAGWAIVYYVAQNASGRFHLKWWQSPLLMAFIALSFDLSLDALAIRLGFWKWNIPLSEEWFGVPYDNFFGWLAVVWTFGLFINYSYQPHIKTATGKVIRYLTPVMSALLLGMQIMLYQNIAATLSGKFTWGETMALYGQQQYYYADVPQVHTLRIYLFFTLVFVLLVTCLIWIYKQRHAAKLSEDRFPFYLSLSAHLTFIFVLFLSGIYRVSWLLVLVSFAALAFIFLLELPAGDKPGGQ